MEPPAAAAATIGRRADRRADRQGQAAASGGCDAGRTADARPGVAAPADTAATPRRLSSDTQPLPDSRTHGDRAGVASRPPPAQGDITKVISNNRAGIKICYQRALARDNTPHARQAGGEAVDRDLGPGQTRRPGRAGAVQALLEPCIKEVVQRWVFPQASEEYGTEFPLVFQGNE